MARTIRTQRAVESAIRATEGASNAQTARDQGISRSMQRNAMPEYGEGQSWQHERPSHARGHGGKSDSIIGGIVGFIEMLGL